LGINLLINRFAYSIYPFSFSTIKSLKKEPKLFLWDYSELKNEAQRFENLIAAHLLKFSHFLYDIYGLRTDLRYMRDFAKREVDFVFLIDNKPVFAVEVKLSATKISNHLKYFQKKIDIPYWYQVVKKEGVDFEKEGIRVMSASKFLTGLV